MADQLIIGYDPGGNGAHGVALLSLVDGRPKAAQTRNLQTAYEVIEYIEGLGTVAALGVDTLTCWSTGASGWRPADRWLRERYRNVQTA